MGQDIPKEDEAEKLLDKIKSNQPEELNTDNDFLGTIPKGNMIKGFLKSLLKRLVVKDKPDIQMIALYGEWGSGKTSLMKYVQSQLPEESFKPIFFRAWEMEKDDNLALSLLEAIIESEDGVDKTDIKEAFFAMGMGICKGLSAKIGPININFKEVMQSVEEYNKSITDNSALKRIKKFKEEYSKLEKLILEKTKCEKLVVFIDDLDRCEPENVLNLLSAIKLFFTFGNRTIFVCGLDEKAVDEAVKVRYNNVIKSGEYMEKIFDISFDMPKPAINKMISYYFNDNAISKPEEPISPENQAIIDGVQKFFEAMHFTNPRHIKKVLNKYLLLRYYKEHGLDGEALIPNQDIEFFRYLTLFIIILYKFESDNFEMIRDYDEKLKHIKYTSNENKKFDYFDNLAALNVSDCKSGSVKSIYRDNWCGNEDVASESFLIKIITLFSPCIEKAYAINMENDPDRLREEKKVYIEQFSKDKTLGLPAFFCHYIDVNLGLLLKDSVKNSEYRLWNIFDMAERYL